MVNYGVSRACQECKHRKKRCDETLPSCERCTKAGRKCPGYRPDSDLIFRHAVQQPYQEAPPSQITVDRVRESSPPTAVDPATFGNLDWTEIEQIAYQTFIAHYCLPSTNRRISRGYLAGLPCLIENARPSVDIDRACNNIVRACNIVAIANLGKMHSAPVLMARAEKLYNKLLASFRLTISNEGSSTTTQSLMTAVLLGHYEILITTSAQPGAHITHARGVSAILTSDSSPYDLLCGGKLFRLSNPLPPDELKIMSMNHSPALSVSKSESFSILCTPVLRKSWPTLDMFFIKAYTLVWKAEALFRSEVIAPDELRLIEEEAEQIRREFPTSEMMPSEEWTPSVIGVIPERNVPRPQVGYWPGPVTTYYDLYVANIINSYLKSRLLLLDTIVKCRRISDPTDASHHDTEASIWREVRAFTSEIASSIPYHLADKAEAFVSQAVDPNNTAKEITPGRCLGGLLLMHAIYVVSTFSVVDPAIKLYFRDCLAWIGTNMGIGQATMLAEAETLSMDLFHYIGEAHTLIWASMLI